MSRKLVSLILLLPLLVAACTVPAPVPIPSAPRATVAVSSTPVAAPPTTAAITPTPAPAVVEQATLYEDPAAHFIVPIPTNWQVERATGYAVLTDPDNAIKVYVLEVAAASVEEGLAAAWGVVDPAFKLPSKDVLKPPAPAGLDEIVQITYDAGSQERVVVAFGERIKEAVFSVLIDGKMDAIVRRAAQVNTIASGLTIKAMPKTDLTNVKAKALTPEMLAELEAFITDAMQRVKVPGAAVAIVENGQVVYLKGFGVREAGKADPVTPDTLMMIGSTTKTMTTLMMATEVDDGLMQWDTPAIQIMPGFAVADPALTKQITMRNLVCACTGVPRRDMELIFNGDELTATAILKSLRTFQFFTKFGEAFQYSNQMVAAGGYIAAMAAGAHADDPYDGYVEQMQRRVFDPIGMAGSTFSLAQVQASGDYATPHGLNLSLQYAPMAPTVERFLTPLAPAGALWSNARDMARYLITELNQGVSPDGQRVVSQKNLAVTWEPQIAISADVSYGLGWMVAHDNGLRLLMHGGNTFGFSTDLTFLPEAGLGIVILANAQYSNLFHGAVRSRLIEMVFDQPQEAEAALDFALETQAKGIKEMKAGLQASVDAAAVAPYLGTFTSDVLGEITLTMQGEKLVADIGEFASELRAKVDDKGKTTYLFADPPLAAMGVPVELQKDEQGNPIIVITVPPDTYTFHRLQ